MSQATTPLMLMTADLAMSFSWPAVTVSTDLLATGVVPCRMVAVAMAVINTLAQLGAFGGPVLWGMGQDSMGSYHFGLTLIPLLFIASAGIAMHLRLSIRTKLMLATAATAVA